MAEMPEPVSRRLESVVEKPGFAAGRLEPVTGRPEPVMEKPKFAVEGPEGSKELLFPWGGGGVMSTNFLPVKRQLRGVLYDRRAKRIPFDNIIIRNQKKVNRPDKIIPRWAFIRPPCR
jgi:hypothetical protein